MSGPALGTGRSVRYALTAAISLSILVAGWLAPEIIAQPPLPATETPTLTPPPPPDIGGQWSIMRTWYRRCPQCASSVVRTTPWRIAQSGTTITVDRGPHGVVAGASAGGGYLALEGIESDGADVLRFRYPTLRIASDARHFEGPFAGSETIQNPCPDGPPVVTCFADAGWISAVLVGAGAATPTQAPTATAPHPAPSATASTTPTPTAPAARTAMASATPGPTATPTVHPLVFPRIGL